MTAERFEVRLESEAFPCERLQIRALSGRERISQLFWFDITLVAPDSEGLDARALSGAIVTMVWLEDGVERRRIHGMIAEVTDVLDTETALSTFRIRLVPRAFRQTLVRMQEIYLDLSVPEIIQKKLALVGLEEDIELRLLPGAERRYPKREYVVQYDETDLAFTSRLAEHVGLSFFFEHIDGRDRLVLTDHAGGFKAAEGAEAAVFRRRGERRDVHRLEIATRVVPATYAVCDYDYQKPLVDLTQVCNLASGYGGAVIEYGSNFKEPDEGESLARARAEEQQASALVLTGESDLCGLSAGFKLAVEGHPRLPEVDLLLVEVEHRFSQAAFSSGDGGEQAYGNVFKAVPGGATYRPPRITPRPRIHGVMSGIVEGAPGVESERPWIDEHGRYTVRILFDTAPPGERKASLPIRMAQSNAGPGHGIHFPLRPGTEVLLIFVGGDPDRPLIVGAVPNALTPTPVTSGEATYHRVRTLSGVQIEIDDGR